MVAGTLPVTCVLPVVAAKTENGDIITDITTSTIATNEILLFIILFSFLFCDMNMGCF
jgi:hypothetical protein